MEKALEKLHEKTKLAKTLVGIDALLGWDQEVYMPAKGINARAEQIAWVSGRIHEAVTDPEIGRLLEELGASEANPSGDPSRPEADRNYIRFVRRAYLQQTRIPLALVEELSKAQSLGQAAWAEARKKDDFPSFKPHLEKLLALQKKVAAHGGFEKKPYDYHLDNHEAGATEASIAAVFGPLGKDLKRILGKIAARHQVADPAAGKKFPAAGQEAFGRIVMEDMGYELERGRLDVSTHPFTTTLASDDVRITTRYHEDNLLSSLFSIVHEAGHALYELGVDEALKDDILSDGCSMGVHESQSRFWENTVGRSRAFWKRYFGKLQGIFPAELGKVAQEDFYRAVNRVEIQPIRVEADEVSYGLHVILRFELERALFSGALEAAAVPGEWRKMAKEWLGLDLKNDAMGCLQDIHWSMGAFGYFPSYALGNLYAAQFAESMAKAIGPIEPLVEAGNFAPVLGWLRTNIHRWGSSLLPSEVCERATGKPLDPAHFIAYLEKKYGEVYGF